MPTVFTHGTEITGARHDLGSKTLDVARLAVDAALRLSAGQIA
ncbi:alpha/beta hydrolase superfamily enzyme%2C predicted hydrolase [Mycobacterium tuberculosis]|nr:alpha/beta hydrolase superfamily enzyme%2C predicted hydrolase [Mycobacterium tuberculosis]